MRRRTLSLLALLISLAWPALAETAFDHSSYDALLSRYVANGRVNYAAWKCAPADLAALDSYLARLGAASLEGRTRPDRLAFYLNAYNAITLKSILDAYPVASIKRIPRVWSRRNWRVAGEEVSLDDIEHARIRPVFRDPRVHFALVCASKGCPPLASRAFTAADVDSQLEACARAYLSAPANVQIDLARRRLTVSKLFSWYGDDFTALTGTIPAFVALYRDDPSEAAALRAGRWQVRYSDYDWTLNE